MADVGFGLEPPARQFNLDFVPVATERYFLLCRNEVMRTPAMQMVVKVLRDTAFRSSLAALPGYNPAASGEVAAFEDAYVFSAISG